MCMFAAVHQEYVTILVVVLFFSGTPLSFARSLKYWATRSSARFGGVVRHCLDGNGEEFEETVKLLMVGKKFKYCIKMYIHILQFELCLVHDKCVLCTSYT